MTEAKKKTARAAKVTPRQDRFCKEYVIDLNGARAYQEVYKCSDKAAESGASRMLRIVKVKARIRELRKRLEKKTGISAERVINEYAKVAFANIKSVLSENNEIVDISKVPDEIAAAVESIQSDIRHDSGDSEGYTEKVKVKFYSKLGALSDLGKHLGIFEKDNEQGKAIAPQIIVFGTPSTKKADDDTD